MDSFDDMHDSILEIGVQPREPSGRRPESAILIESSGEAKKKKQIRRKKRINKKKKRRRN